MYARPMVKDYSDVAELTGLCDVNPRRMEVARSWIGRDIPGFTDFDEMLDKVPCDVVIVTSKDSTHHEYIIKALRRGKDVITEKPMTIDAEKCRAILAAERESKGHITVTFNYRFTP
ncbi:MAG TPA: Gfo/Idh/MocA family oxidoreductase, partial [Firmicutes bacterium]|nr:Gfo/Idh/MocA family oxidoreductase [Bacillota bacterium]